MRIIQGVPICSELIQFVTLYYEIEKILWIWYFKMKNNPAKYLIRNGNNQIERVGTLLN